MRLLGYDRYVRKRELLLPTPVLASSSRDQRASSRVVTAIPEVGPRVQLQALHGYVC